MVLKLGIAGTALVVVGIILIIGGNPVLGIFALIAGTLLELAAAAFAAVRRVIREAREAYTLVRAGKEARLVGIKGPKGIFVQRFEAEFEVSADEVSRTVTKSIPIPFFAGWAIRAGRKLPFPTPELDTSRMRVDIEKIRQRARPASGAPTTQEEG